MLYGYSADYSAFQIGAAGLLSAGYNGVIRYINDPRLYPNKGITGGEFHDLVTTPGIQLALVWESFSQAATWGGYDLGCREAAAAFGRATSLGWPASRPIYFVGEDPNSLSPPWPNIEAYFRGVATVAPASRIGDYGSARQINQILSMGLASYGWAVETWPGNKSRCNLEQHYNSYPNSPTRFGGQVDLNLILQPDWGQWSAVTPSPDIVPPTPIPVRQPVFFTPKEGEVIQSDQIVANQQDTFSVDGGGRLQHFYYTDAASWESEVLIDGCRPYSELAINPKWAHDGNSHVFAEKADGGQIHCYWNGTVWSHDIQAPPSR